VGTTNHIVGGVFMKQKTETSKKLAWFSGICFALTLLFSMGVFVYSLIFNMMVDFTLPITLASVTGAVFGTACAFYYNKSKSENLFKIKRSFLKIKYLILKIINSLDELRVQCELENELSKIESDLDMEEEKLKEDITYNQQV
jgi:hypothetical protein